ncbi:MAG: hypothetical protein QM740_20150 [Acidovorax sp.]
MLKETLERMERTLPFRSFSDDQQRWGAVSAECAERIGPIAQALLAQVPSPALTRVLAQSTCEILSSHQPRVEMAEFRIRPSSDYYAHWRRRPPRPEDPLGTDATGLAITLALCRGFATTDHANPPFLALDFEVWGAHERERFADLLRDHRYLTDMLVTRSGAALFTSCVFQNIVDADYVSTFEKLLLYYENRTDPENQFALQCKFGAKSNEADILHALSVALALYDGALGYCLPLAHRERLLDHVGTAVSLHRG